MKSLVIIDGVDNTGKTWVVDKVKEMCPAQIETAKFPSEELTNSDIFKSIIEDKSVENKKRWILELFKEEHDELSKYTNDEVVFVDRMWFSSLIYQGDGPDGNFAFESYVNREYNSLMKMLDLHPKQIWHILFMYPLAAKDASETNETKKAFDSKQISLMKKMNWLLHAIASQNVNTLSRFLRNIVIYEEDYLKEKHIAGEIPHLSMIQSIQNHRVMELLNSFVQDKSSLCDPESFSIGRLLLESHLHTT